MTDDLAAPVTDDSAPRTDPRVAQYAAERDDLAAAIHKAMASSYIGPPRPMLLGDADRAVAAVLAAGWRPPAEGAVEEFDEWRLTGWPQSGNAGLGSPPYDFIARTREHIEAVRVVWAKTQTGEYDWRDAKLVRRHVTITRAPWVDVDDETGHTT